MNKHPLESLRPLVVATMLFVVVLLLALSGCAMYRITVDAADGSKLSGVAVVANNSEDVALKVRSKDLTISFGKSGTDGEVQAATLTDLTQVLAP
jgi:hypothetical protein